MNDAVKAFWDQQALQHGISDLATAPDHYYRELEISHIKEHLPFAARVLDVGCGNGYSTLAFAEHLPLSSFIIGIDYSEEMIAQAKTREHARYIKFEVADITKPLPYGKFDCIISERCLINLASWQEQQEAILRLRSHLAKGGRLILVENTLAGLNALNSLRAIFGLSPIEMRWHNNYLPEEIDDFLLDNFNVMHAENIGNLYYIISRVVYAAICAQQSGLPPDYNDIHNMIAAKLPSLGDYNYSPNWLWVLSV